MSWPDAVFSATSRVAVAALNSGSLLATVIVCGGRAFAHLGIVGVVGKGDHDLDGIAHVRRDQRIAGRVGADIGLRVVAGHADPLVAVADRCESVAVCDAGCRYGQRLSDLRGARDGRHACGRAVRGAPACI